MTTSSITFLRPIQVAIIIIVTAFVSWSCRQPEGDTASTEQINNTKGDKHVKITGTHVYIVPPEGFSTTATGEAYVDFTTTARITVTQSERPFNRDSEHDDSPNVTDQHNVDVNHYKGFSKSIREKDFAKEILNFGNDHVTVTLTATIPGADSAIINKVRIAIRSVVLLDEKLPDPSDDAIYKVDVQDTPLKFARLINGMLIYTESGDMLSASRFNFIVASKYITDATPDKQKTIAEEYLRNELHYKDIRIKESKPVTIDGFSGYEFTAEGTQMDANTHDLMYLVMLFDNSNAYAIFGTATEDFESSETMFRQVAQTFHLKNGN